MPRWLRVSSTSPATGQPSMALLLPPWIRSGVAWVQRLVDLLQQGLADVAVHAHQKRSSSGKGSCPWCTCMAPNSAQRCRVGMFFAGVEQTLRVEGSLDRMEQGDFVAVELCAHLVDLLAPHAVFAGDAAAYGHAQLEDFAADGFGTFQLAWQVGIEQDQRVHVAVAGMEHVGHAQAVFGGQVADALEHPWQFAARDGAVHAVVVRGDTAHRREGVLAPGPEAHALGLIAGQPHITRTGLGQHGGHPFAVIVHIGFDAIQFAQQDGRSVEPGSRRG
ncbi:hypothetical protein PPS11_44338 [Pseudomonas putida S11]|nr:hypothetical protein PPS11_44338 [Pseudomonas putida S11]